MSAEPQAAATAPIHAVSAEFESAAALLDGVKALRGRGFGTLEAMSPVPIAGMADALGLGRSSLSLVSLGAVLLGFAASMAMCIYATAENYVFDIGGRPRISWPAFVVPSVSFSLMAGAVVVYLAMLFLNRLPRLNHPVFNIPDFSRVTQDRYFLAVVEGNAPLDPDAIEAALGDLPARPLRVARVRR